MPNYRNGKIYCIRSHQTDKVYVGSTCVGLSQRLANHRGKYKSYKNGKYHNVTSFELLQYNDAYIELIENCPCNSKEELQRKEGEYIRSMNCVNKVVPRRTPKQYYEDNKEIIIQKKKQYYEDNKEIITQKKKQYRQANKEKIAKRDKQYYEANKDKLLKNMKQYREANKEIINKKHEEYVSKKVYCKFCDKHMRRDSMRRHERTKKHIENFILY